jgi:hypothetical protein
MRGPKVSPERPLTPVGQIFLEDRHLKLNERSSLVIDEQHR